MKKYWFKLKILKIYEIFILITIFLFLCIQVTSAALFSVENKNLDLLFQPLTNLLFVIGFLIYIIFVSLKNFNSLIKSYLIAKNSKKVIFDDEIMKKIFGFLLISIVVAIFHILQFFNIFNFNLNPTIYIFITTLVAIFATLVPIFFLIFIFYIVKFRKNKVDKILIIVSSSINIEIYFNKEINFKYNITKFNFYVTTFMRNKNINITLLICIKISEYLKNFKKGKTPPIINI